MIIAIMSLSLLGLGLGVMLGLAGRYLKVEQDPIVTEIEAMLPGSQCGQCGFPGCQPAAEALAAGTAPVTMCPPGGRMLAEELAAKLGVTADFSGMQEQVRALHPSFGQGHGFLLDEAGLLQFLELADGTAQL